MRARMADALDPKTERLTGVIRAHDGSGKVDEVVGLTVNSGICIDTLFS